MEATCKSWRDTIISGSQNIWPSREETAPFILYAVGCSSEAHQCCRNMASCCKSLANIGMRPYSAPAPADIPTSKSAASNKPINAGRSQVVETHSGSASFLQENEGHGSPCPDPTLTPTTQSSVHHTAARLDIIWCGRIASEEIVQGSQLRNGVDVTMLLGTEPDTNTAKIPHYASSKETWTDIGDQPARCGPQSSFLPSSSPPFPDSLLSSQMLHSWLSPYAPLGNSSYFNLLSTPRFVLNPPFSPVPSSERQPRQHPLPPKAWSECQ